MKRATWVVEEVSTLVRGDCGILHAILRGRDEAMTDCHVALELSGELLQIMDQLEREIIKRIYEHLPEVS